MKDDVFQFVMWILGLAVLVAAMTAWVESDCRARGGQVKWLYKASLCLDAHGRILP